MLDLYEPVKDPYSWSTTQNVLYYGFSRIAFSISCMLIFLAIVTGHFNIGKKALSNPYFTAMGKLTFIAALIFPIIIMYYCGSGENALYLSFLSVFQMGVGNILCELLSAFVIYMVVEYPLKNLLRRTLFPKLSHDNLIRHKLGLRNSEDSMSKVKTEEFLLAKKI